MKKKKTKHKKEYIELIKLINANSIRLLVSVNLISKIDHDRAD